MTDHRFSPRHRPWLLHPAFVPFPITCFIGTLLTDIAYADTANMQWANFSAWLLTAGLITGALAMIAGAIDFARSAEMRRSEAARVHAGGNVVVMLLAFWNILVHSRDAWTSVVPTGIVLSAITVALMLVTGFLGGIVAARRLRTGEAA